MGLLTYRITRLAIAALIFVLAIFAVRSLRQLDVETAQTLQHINLRWSHFYAQRNAEISKDVRIVDLNLTLNDRAPTIKQACARLMDSLRTYGARVIAVDIFFDPYIDTSGTAALLQAARQCANAVFGFKFTKETGSDLVAKLNRIGRHAIPYSLALKATLPHRNLHGVALPLAGLTETAYCMGFIEIFPEIDGRVQFYPLFQRLGGVDSLFAGLSTQAFRLWLEKDESRDAKPQWRLQDYFDQLLAHNTIWEEDGRLRIIRVPGPIRPNFSWQDVARGEARPAAFADKLVLIVNSLTEEGDMLLAEDYPLWGYHASVVSQLIRNNAAPVLDMMVWLLLLALYSGWVYVRLWPSRRNLRLAERHWVLWAGGALLLVLLPLLLPGPSLLSNDPVAALLLMGIALFAFDTFERRIMKIPQVKFHDLHFVLDETESGEVRLNIQQAPARLGNKRSIFELPPGKAGPWRGYHLPAYLSDPPAMRVLGESLDAFLLAHEVGSVFVASLEAIAKEAQSSAKSVMLRLKIFNQTKNFAGLPIEMLRNSEKNYGYAGLHDHLCFARDLTADPSRELSWSLPMRLLVLTASPKAYGYSPLDFAAETHKIYQSTRILRRKGWLRITVMDRVTPADLENLPSTSFDIIHFIGHGVIDERTQSNCLVFENPGRGEMLIHAEFFGQCLRQFRPRLIFLNACKTAQGTEAGVFINIGRELQRTTGAAVIAHQFAISDYGGVVFSDAFYEVFARTLSPELALNRARQKVAGTVDTFPSDWASPVYFMP